MITNDKLFIHIRLSSNAVSESSTQYETLFLRPLDNICLRDPIMQFLIRKIQHIGQSIELLVSLDRITDIWRINVGGNGDWYNFNYLSFLLL